MLLCLCARALSWLPFSCRCVSECSGVWWLLLSLPVQLGSLLLVVSCCCSFLLMEYDVGLSGCHRCSRRRDGGGDGP